MIVRDHRESIRGNRIDGDARGNGSGRQQSSLREVGIREKDVVAVVNHEGGVSDPGDAGTGFHPLEVGPVVFDGGNFRLALLVIRIGREELPVDDVPEGLWVALPRIEEPADLPVRCLQERRVRCILSGDLTARERAGLRLARAPQGAPRRRVFSSFARVTMGLKESVLAPLVKGSLRSSRCVSCYRRSPTA